MSKHLDLIDLESLYSKEIEKAKKFLENRKVVANGSNLSPTKVEFLLETKAQCPLCGIKLQGANHNTEHIHPRGIGGENTQENKIQICITCNNSRNQVMQSLLGRPPFHKAYPEKWVAIRKLLIWSLSSIDIGDSAVRQLPEFQDLFLECRTGGLPMHTIPTTAFHRSSTWKIGDEPNSPLNGIKAVPKKVLPKKSRGFFVTILDKLFGFDPEEKIPSPKKEKAASPKKEKFSRPKKKPKAKEIVEEKAVELEQYDFLERMRYFLGEDEMSMVKLGSKMREWQEKEGWKEFGTKVFLARCGLKPSAGLMKTIKEKMAKEVEITGKSPNYYIKVKKKPQPKPKKKVKGKSVEKPVEDARFDFVEIIRTLMSSEEALTMNMLGHNIRVWQEEKGFKDVNSKTFLVRCGLKPSAGLMNTIRELMGDEVEITGEEPPFTIRMLK